MFCVFGVGLVVATGPNSAGGVMVQPVKAPISTPSEGSVPSQCVSQVLERSVMSPERGTLVQPGIVSGIISSDNVHSPDQNSPELVTNNYNDHTNTSINASNLGDISIQGTSEVSINIQSTHPYANNYDYTWSNLKGPSGTKQMRIHFTKIVLAYGDHLYLLDDEGNELQDFTYTTKENYYSEWFTGNSFQLRLKTNSNTNAYGFTSDKLDCRTSDAPETTNIAESFHDYANNYDYTWSNLNGPPGTKQMRIHFTKIVLAYGDHLYLLDNEGNELQDFTYTTKENYYSEWFTGNSFQLWLKTNSNTNAYGFTSDKLDCRTSDAPVTTNIAESFHDYANNFDYTWSGLNGPSGTKQMRIHFTKIVLAYGDHLYLLDNEGNELQDFTYTTKENYYSEWFTGNSFQLRLKTNSNTNAYGFTSDKLDCRTSDVPETTNIAESFHNYANNFEYTWLIQGDSSTTQMRIHFTKIDLAYGDHLYLLDNEGNELQDFTYTTKDNYWTEWYTGNSFQLRLKTNGDTNKYGFTVDKTDPESDPVPVSPVVTAIFPSSVISGTNPFVVTSISGLRFSTSGTVNKIRLDDAAGHFFDCTMIGTVSDGSITGTRFNLAGAAAGVYYVKVSKDNGNTWISSSTKLLTITASVSGKNIGVLRGNKWYLDNNGNGAWNGPSTDRQYTFGLSGDKPVTGNWNYDGKTKIGVFRGNKWYLDYNGNGVWNGPSTDRQYTFGLSGDKPITGDWNGDGKAKIGVFRGNKWYLDNNGNGAWNGPSTDRQYTFGLSGDTPVTGDWNGDGKTDIGVFRGNKWYLDNNGNGAWNGPSSDREYTFGLAGDKPVTGDWNGDGKTDIGVYRGNKWYLDSSGNGAWGTGDKTITFGLSGDTPVTGKWSGSSGTASIQSVDLYPITKPENTFKVPDVARPVVAVPKVEMPVKSNSAMNVITQGVVPSHSNPLVSGGKKISGNPLS
ncbi:VCBS repeat-containing protein [Methanospirillum purgamenti]|uniref:VCBS repeat-containing protein n=1 Tax=Methanospirillum purgamenti TaxID=2834276 RepID=UPI002A23CAB5|nr:VCBS repeat-containing protein [Methanospirillum hungatei]